jgi:NTP pyrophosphatase (non-canonical NTP hydrolase)
MKAVWGFHAIGNDQRMNNIEHYQKFVKSVSIYPDAGRNLVYPAMGLVGEVGEFFNKLKKVDRDNAGRLDEEFEAMLVQELGDALWYHAAICNEVNLEMRDILSIHAKEKILTWKELDRYFEKKVGLTADSLHQASFSFSFAGYRFAFYIHRIVELRPRDAADYLRNDGEFKLWFKGSVRNIWQVAYFLESSLYSAATMNYRILSDRKERGKLHGSGDDR